MALIDILQQIVNAATAPDARQIDQVTREASKDDLRSGVTEALRSEQTPPLSEMVGAMFEKASPQERADILNTLVEKLGPGALAGVAGGALAGHEGRDAPLVPVDKASAITIDQVRDVVDTAERHDEPGLMDRLGGFYAEHPDLVKTLGAGALMIALARIKNNLGR